MATLIKSELDLRQRVGQIETKNLGMPILLPREGRLFSALVLSKA